MNNFLRINQRFVIDQDTLIGKGSTGNVYLGFQPSNFHKQYAVKTIDLNKIDNPVTNYLLACEIQALSELSKRNCPYIVKTQQIIYHGQHCYLIMELLEGGSLTEYIRDHSGGIAERKALDLFRQMIQAYGVIKMQGIIHRDIKPDNLIFRKGQNSNRQIMSQNQLCFIDFGYCLKQGVPNQPEGYYNVGSPKYMSPQAFNESKYSQKSDIWAMGVILYEMLHGRTIDRGMNMEQYFDIMKKGDIKNWKGISQSVWELLLGMLMYKSQRRLGYEDIFKRLSSNNSVNVNESQFLQSQERVERYPMERRSLMSNRKESCVNLPLKKVSPRKAFYEEEKCKSVIFPDWGSQTIGGLEQSHQEINFSHIFPINNGHNISQPTIQPSVHQSCMMMAPIRYLNHSPQSQQQQQSPSRFNTNVMPSKQQHYHNNNHQPRVSTSMFEPSFIQPMNSNVQQQDQNSNKFIRREIIFKPSIDSPVHHQAGNNRMTAVVNHYHHQPQHKQHITPFVYPTNPPPSSIASIQQQHSNTSTFIRTNGKGNTNYYIGNNNTTPQLIENLNNTKSTNFLLPSIPSNNNINHSQNTIKLSSYAISFKQIPTNIRPTNPLALNAEENDEVINPPLASNQTKRMSWYFDSSHGNSNIQKDNHDMFNHFNHRIHHNNNPQQQQHAFGNHINNNIPKQSPVFIQQPSNLNTSINNNINWSTPSKSLTVPIGGLKRVVRFSTSKQHQKRLYQQKHKIVNNSNNNSVNHYQHFPTHDTNQFISYHQHPPNSSFNHSQQQSIYRHNNYN